MIVESTKWIVVLLCALFCPELSYSQGINGPEKFQLSPILFELSNGESIDAEKGFLQVPENRNASKSRLIPLNFVKFNSISSNPSSTIFYLAGGPGNSGLQVAARRFSLFSMLREIADVVVIEQRGTGSNDMTCPERIYLPITRSLEYEEVVELFIDNTLPCKAHFENLGFDLSGYTTVESAHDVNAIREALMLDKISLIGSSYGSHYALAVLKLYEDIVDRVVISGIEGPDHSLSLPSNFDKHLDDIDALVRRESTSYTDFPDLQDTLRTTIDRLNNSPVTVSVPSTLENKSVDVQIGKFELQLLLYSLLGRDRSIGQVPKLIYDMSDGDYRGAAQMIYQIKSSGQSISAMLIMTDGASGASNERLAQLRAEKDTAILGPVAHFLFPEIAAAWRTPDLGAKYRAPIRSDHPVLILSGSMDARTPIYNGSEIAEGLTNSIHLIVENAGHPPSLTDSASLISEFMKGSSILTSRPPKVALEFAPL